MARDLLRVITCGSVNGGKSTLVGRLLSDAGIAENRKFTFADGPASASTADLAVIVVDASKGLLAQARHHSYLVHLFGIRDVVLAINKMDLVGCASERFEAIAREYKSFASGIGLRQVAAVPTIAVDADNVSHASARMPWYQGKTVRELLEAATPQDGSVERAFRMPVQRVNHASDELRAYTGTIVSGTIRRGGRWFGWAKNRYSPAATT